ncbi:protein unc-93 homolog A-like [Watersipora subatra]|uniref:protein unc-93 homolog A-like n=1 Tax=Watersipora subatra TaxID=2589382 RepID=UPI00355B6AF5
MTERDWWKCIVKKDDHRSVQKMISTSVKYRFTVQPVVQNEAEPLEPTSDVELSQSTPSSRFASEYDLNIGEDIASLGNTSRFSQFTADLISAPGNALSWLSDPGQVLGSSLLLASQSYLDVYQEVLSQKSGKDATVFDTVNEEDEDGDIFDNSEYIDTLEGRLPLAEAARMVAKDSSRHGSLFSSSHVRKVRIDCYKRLTTIGLAFLLVFSSSFSVRNAMNSLGEDKQLSLVCYGSLFCFMWFGGVCVNPLMSKLRPKWIMVLSTTGFIIYPLSMFYMSYYLTLPASLYSGFCIGLWWAVEGVYILNISTTYSLVSTEPLQQVVTKFNGVVFCFFLCSHIVGNLLSSLLLGDLFFLYESTELANRPFNLTSTSYAGLFVTDQNNESAQEVGDLNCGLSYYDGEGKTSSKTVQIGKQYIYFAVNTLLPILACLLIVICLRTLKVAKRPGSGSLKKTMQELLETGKDPRTLLLMPLLIGMGYMASLMLANYSAGFISCAYGVDKLGYVIMVAFAFSAAGAFTSGRLVQAIGRAPVIITSILISLTSAACLLLWVPPNTKLHPVAFLIPCLWALSDGVLGTQINSFVAVIFRRKIAYAMTLVVTGIGMGSLVGTFGIAFGLFTFTVKVYIALILVCLSCFCFLILELLLKKGTL